MALNAFNIPLYSPGRAQEARYRNALNDLLERIEARPTTRTICYHTIARRRFIDGEAGLFGAHQTWQCASSQDGRGQGIYTDHNVALQAKDGSWFALLGQPYMTSLDADRYRDIKLMTGRPLQLPPGIAVVNIGPAPYNPTGAIGLLFVREDLANWFAERSDGHIIASRRGDPYVFGRCIVQYADGTTCRRPWKLFKLCADHYLEQQRLLHAHAGSLRFVTGPQPRPIVESEVAR